MAQLAPLARVLLLGLVACKGGADDRLLTSDESD